MTDTGLEVEWPHTLLSDEKMSMAVRALMLKHGLIDTNCGRPEYLEALGMRGFCLANREAADLVLAHVADRIGRHYGWPTTTDGQLSFTVNSLNALDEAPGVNPQALLARSIIKVQVPQGLNLFSMEQYTELRDGFSEVRESFHRMVAELAATYDLNRTYAPDALQNRAEEIASDFDGRMAIARRRGSLRDVAEWTSIGVAMMGLIGTACARPQLAFIGGAVSLATQVLARVTDMTGTPRQERRLANTLLSLRRRAMTAAEVRTLI
jgi:hypothetical protein